MPGFINTQARQSHKMYQRVMTFQLSPNKNYLCVRETGHSLMVHIPAPIIAVRNNRSPMPMHTVLDNYNAHKKM